MARRISNTSLADVIRRNSNISNVQANVFFFQSSMSGTAFVDVNHDGQQSFGEPGVPGAIVQLMSEANDEMVVARSSDSRGSYRFDVSDGLRTGPYHVQVVSAAGQVLGISRTIAVTRGGQLFDRVNIALPPG